MGGAEAESVLTWKGDFLLFVFINKDTSAKANSL